MENIMEVIKEAAQTAKRFKASAFRSESGRPDSQNFKTKRHSGAPEFSLTAGFHSPLTFIELEWDQMFTKHVY